MRIVIDLQAAQTTSSRDRGIGRYSLALTKALAKIKANHELIIILNGAFLETIKPIRHQFKNLLPDENILIWNALRPVNGFDETSGNRKYVSELIREAFIESLNPDILHIFSLFEGFDDDAVHSIGLSEHKYIVSTTFYDLIPLLQSHIYLDPNPIFKKLYFEKLTYLKKSDIYLAISESSRQELINSLKINPSQVINVGAGVSKKFKKKIISTELTQKIKTKFKIQSKFILYSGAADERKNHRGLILAYKKLPKILQSEYQLIFAGKIPTSILNELKDFALNQKLSPHNVIFTDYLSDEELVALYNLCDLFVFPSWHEGFGLPALEALSCGAAVIGSNTTSIPEVIGRKEALFDPYDPTDIANKIQEVLQNPHLKKNLQDHGPIQAKKFSWEIAARRALDFFEQSHEKKIKSTQHANNQNLLFDSPHWLIPKIVNSGKIEITSNEWNLTNKIIRENHRIQRVPKIFVDVSEIIHRDQGTGIQRVVRSILLEMLTQKNEEYEVIPVYATTSNLGYFYAYDFGKKFFDTEFSQEKNNTLIDFQSGDIFFGLDIQFAVIPEQEIFYKELHQSGVKIIFMIHDLLPVLMPHYFETNVTHFYEKWLKTITTKADAIITVSKAVADQLFNWVSQNPPPRHTPLRIGWSHNGADIQASKPTFGIPSEAEELLKKWGQNPTFLSVGTLEPRKGHAQILDAFEILWSKGTIANLIFVGKQGWNIEQLIERINHHPKNNMHLFWLKGISDEYLDKIYEHSSCLLAASQGEGFGLPIIEAAKHGMPIIARDIPVFREVAGASATFFSGTEGGDLATVIEKWIKGYQNNNIINSNTIQYLTWKESTNNLIRIITQDDWYQIWQPRSY